MLFVATCSVNSAFIARSRRAFVSCLRNPFLPMMSSGFLKPARSVSISFVSIASIASSSPSLLYPMAVFLHPRNSDRNRSRTLMAAIAQPVVWPCRSAAARDCPGRIYCEIGSSQRNSGPRHDYNRAVCRFTPHWIEPSLANRYVTRRLQTNTHGPAPPLKSRAATSLIYRRVCTTTVERCFH